MTTSYSVAHLSVSTYRTRLDLVRAAAFVVVTIQYAYVFTFNHAPESVRTAFAGTLLALHLMLAVLSLGQRPQTWQTAILLSIAMVVSCWLVSHGISMGSRQLDTVEAFRDLSIYVMPLWLLAFAEVIPHRFVIALAVGSTVVGGMLALSGPPVYAGGRLRLASITGGIMQYGASAMFIADQLVLVHVYCRARMLSSLIAWPTILFALLILLAYRGRTEMVLVGTYFATLGYFRFRSVPAIRWSPPILLVLFVIASALALSYGHDPRSWGSGRIGVWQYRLGLIWSRDLVPFLFGGGLGADRIWSGPEWLLLGAQPAHNDFLHIVMETGLVGLMATFIFLAGLLMRLPGSSKSIVIAVVFASFVGNGHLQSPFLALNLFVVTAAALHCWHVRHVQGRTDPP